MASVGDTGEAGRLPAVSVNSSSMCITIVIRLVVLSLLLFLSLLLPSTLLLHY